MARGSFKTGTDAPTIALAITDAREGAVIEMRFAFLICNKWSGITNPS